MRPARRAINHLNWARNVNGSLLQNGQLRQSLEHSSGSLCLLAVSLVGANLLNERKSTRPFWLASHILAPEYGTRNWPGERQRPLCITQW